MPSEFPDLRISTTSEEIDFPSFRAVYESVGFHLSDARACDDDYLKRAFGPGAFGFFAFADDRLVGIARVLSDDVICSFIAEICVHSDWQRKGIGHAILDAAIHRFSHTAIYADSFSSQVEFFRMKGIVPQSRLVACGKAPLSTNER